MAEEAQSALALFLAQRPRLRLLAYRLLGSTGDADDVVQDAWLKWHPVADRVDHPAAFLTTQVTRLAIDRLRAARRRADALQATPWLPEPWAEPLAPGESDLSTGLLLLLERLTPDQRAVYVLREAMDLDFAEIADVLDKPVATCRQIMHRARAALVATPRVPMERGQAAALVARFAAACDQRDYRALVALLSEDARLLSDGGTKVRAARNPILGPDRIGRFLLGVRRKFTPEGFALRPVTANGQPALMGEVEGEVRWILTFAHAQGRIAGIYLQADPDKLAGWRM